MGALYDVLRAAADRKDGAAPRAMRTIPTRSSRRCPTTRPPAPKVLQLAIVGRPNVGKSTLVNALLGEERLLTGPEAGITRDAIAVDWYWKGTPIRLIDTAGLRRRARVVEKLERLSGADTDRAVRYAHVVVLVLDANDMLEKQDLTIARHVDRGRPRAGHRRQQVGRDRGQERGAEKAEGPGRQIAAAGDGGSGRHAVGALRPQSRQADAGGLQDLRRSGTSACRPRSSTAISKAATVAHPPPLVRGRRIKLRYMTQIKTRPPTFALFAAEGGRAAGCLSRAT